MTDKTKHVIVGFSIGLSTLPISYFSGIFWALLITFVVGSIVFICKEICDKYKPYPTGFDKMDLIADYLGWVSGAIVSYFTWGIIQIISLFI